MNAPLNTDYQLLLELKLRRVSGNDFQKFFSEIMEAKYGDDFVRVKPYGSLGDKGCDGYLASTGSVYACHGAQNGVLGSVSSFRKKMASDFKKASSNLGHIMTSWHMVHNIVEGLPAEALLELKSLEQQNPSVEFSLFGLPSMAETMAGFPESELEKFLGRRARNEDFRNFQISEVKDLVDAIVSATSEHKPMTDEITPVSSEKIDYNEIPGTWVAALQGGRLNEHHIQRYFEQHQVPTRGEMLASIFRSRYSELVAEKLPPASIMYWLYVRIVGQDEVEVSRQVAAHTLLAYLFERCEIFENAVEGSQA